MPVVPVSYSRWLSSLIAAFLTWGLIASPVLAGSENSVLVLQVDGVIGPATVDYLHRGLNRAAESGAGLVVIKMDTPGGLDTSMRAIIKDILASPVPVATFVAPSGARAASAGTYILYASHIAAMAPGTNLGAATPVNIGLGGVAKPAADGAAKESDENRKPSKAHKVDGDPMAAKIASDASAYIRSLAQLRGREVKFAEQAVLEAASLSASEALKRHVIDLMASDLPDLFGKLDGRQVAMPNTTLTLSTAKASVTLLEPDTRNRVLALIANPQVALILMMIGLYGLFFELTSPGFGVPGVAGAIALLVALYAFQMLPVNWAGVALLALGAAMMLAEAFMPSFGALGVGGVIAFVLGGVFLMDSDVPGFGIPLALIGGMALASLAILLGIGSLAARSFKRPVVSGREELAGMPGTVIGPAIGGDWWVTVHGENWRARCAQPLSAGGAVRVNRLDGLILDVSPVGSTTNQGSKPS